MALSAVKPEIRIHHFEGPLDLLCHLIEKNDIDIYDIPISEITSQYMDYLSAMKSLDMDVASEFLLMGATLVHIKSRMMLPGKKSDGTAGAEEDPREELVISLMRYKRCRVFANELRERRAKYEGARFRTRMTAKGLGIDTKKISSDFEKDEFSKAIDEINNRNELRFNDISAKIKHILRRDKISVKERMKSLWLTITKKGKLFFSELFKGKKVEKIDRIVSFLAILELVRNNDITAEQKGSFEDILIEEKRK
ncbi:MAG: segregation/condensation protein A [Clostridiales bacterium]|nr:segregation/condensation protein A [Clostridiales bacterium]